jgi:hypothetical protein
MAPKLSAIEAANNTSPTTTSEMLNHPHKD